MKLTSFLKEIDYSKEELTYLIDEAMRFKQLKKDKIPHKELTGLKVVASWALAGTQVQLYDENGDIVANLLLSGDKFIGTLAGGTGISMV